MERFCSKQSFFEVQAIRKIYCVHLCLLVCLCFLPHALILPSSGKFSGHQATHPPFPSLPPSVGVSEGGQGGSTSSIPHPSAKQHQYSGQYSASWRAREEQERRRKGDSKISISQHPIEVRSQKKYILESYTFLLDFTASCLLNLVARLCSRSPSSSCPSSSCPPSGGTTWRPYVNRRPAPRCRPPSRSRSSRRLRHGRHRRG